MTPLQYSLSEKYAIVNILSMIMEADTVIHPNEIEYMNSILSHFSITVEDHDQMDEMDLQMCKTIIRQMSEEKRCAAKEMFMHMAVVDGHIDSREIQLIEDL